MEIEAAGLFAVAGDDLEAGLQVAEAAGFIIMAFERPQRDGVIGDDYERRLATVFAREWVRLQMAEWEGFEPSVRLFNRTTV